MKMIPQLTDLPELEALPADQRKRLAKAYSSQVNRRPMMRLLVVGLFVFYIAAAEAFRYAFPELKHSWCEFVGRMVLGVLLFHLHAVLVIRLSIPALRLELGRCPACGYDLRATPDPAGPRLPRCPECGRQRD